MANDGPGSQHPTLFLAKRGEAGLDEVLHAPWHRPGLGFRFDQATIGLPPQSSRFDQRVQRFDQEEGVAVTVFVKTTWQVRWPLGSQMSEHLTDCLLIQGRQPQHRRCSGVASSSQQMVKIGRVGRCFGTVGANDEQRVRCHVARDIMKQFQRSLVGPMEVVKPEQQGARLRQTDERLGHALEQPQLALGDRRALNVVGRRG